jgi:lipopolysaccharide export system permease protein
MPIIWRYLVTHFLKVLVFCILAFIAILMTTRLDEIAHFATLSPEGYYILLFTLYQIPYILPIALPISCLISSILLIQRLSRTYELTALRASGMSIMAILAPLLMTSIFLSIANFYVVSELSTHSHLSTSLLKNELRSINPLLLLHNKHLMRLKGIFFNTMGSSKLGESATDVVIAMPNKQNNRINVMLAKKLEAYPSKFKGKGVTLISNTESNKPQHPDPLFVENIAVTTTSIHDFTQILQKKVWSLNNDHLRLPFLYIKLQEEKMSLEKALAENEPESIQKQIKRSINRCYTEFVRRFSIALAVFTFTLMGAAFGISISRTPSNKGLFVVIGLASIYIVAFFSAKGIDHLLIASSLLYLTPHLFIMASSLWILRKAAKGIE